MSELLSIIIKGFNVKTNKQVIAAMWKMVWVFTILLFVACTQSAQSPPAFSLPSPPAGHPVVLPSIGSSPLKLSLTPFPPLSESDMTAVLSGGENPSQKITYEWERNGVIIPYESSATLSKNQFKRGDTLKVSILLNGGNDKWTSDQVVVQNSPPKMTKAGIEPAKPTKRDILKVIVESTDADGDPVTYIYRWFKEDGTVMGSDATLPAGLFAKGEKVNVEVIPSDGQAKGQAMTANTVIVNAVPEITSSPPPLSGKEYLYQVKAEDPDKDPVTFSLLKAPPGMLINPETGLLKWALSDKDVGTFPIKIKVSDPNGAEIIQTFDLSISFVTSTAASSTPAGTEAEKYR
ncbi:MAG: putative Ig domain-containing protein [Nitrospiria bacterium]